MASVAAAQLRGLQRAGALPYEVFPTPRKTDALTLALYVKSSELLLKIHVCNTAQATQLLFMYVGMRSSGKHTPSGIRRTWWNGKLCRERTAASRHSQGPMATCAVQSDVHESLVHTRPPFH